MTYDQIFTILTSCLVGYSQQIIERGFLPRIYTAQILGQKLFRTIQFVGLLTLGHIGTLRKRENNKDPSPSQLRGMTLESAQIMKEKRYTVFLYRGKGQECREASKCRNVCSDLLNIESKSSSEWKTWLQKRESLLMAFALFRYYSPTCIIRSLAPSQGIQNIRDYL